MCVYTYIYICICTYLYIFISLSLYLSLSLSLSICIYIYMYINGSCPQIVASYLCELRSQTLMTGARSAEPQKSARHVSGGCRCALVGVPWRGSVSARLAWGDIVSFNMLSKVLKMLSILRRQGTPMRAHLQPPECTTISCLVWFNGATGPILIM